MPTRLLACRSCGRHVFATEPKCPFCGGAGPARALASAVTLGASLSLLACDRDAKTAAPSAQAVTDAAAAPTAAAPTESAAPSPAALADAGGDLAVGTGLRFDESLGDAGLGGLYGLRTSAGVYGPAQPTSGLAAIGGPRAEVSTNEATSTVPIDDLQRVIAGARGRVRVACQKALESDPTIDGSIQLTLSVAPDGTVSSVDAKGSRVPDSLVAQVSRVYKGMQFAPPGKGGKVTSKVTCRVAKP